MGDVFVDSVIKFYGSLGELLQQQGNGDTPTHCAIYITVIRLVSMVFQYWFAWNFASCNTQIWREKFKCIQQSCLGGSEAYKSTKELEEVCMHQSHITSEQCIEERLSSENRLIEVHKLCE